MKSTVSVKAKSLREGDKVELEDGLIGTVKHVKTHKKVIPRRTVEQTSVEIEVKKKSGNRSFVSAVHMFTHSDDELPVTARKGYAWKYDQFMNKHHRYVNAFASAVAGAVLTSTMYGSGVVLASGALAMLAGTAAVSLSLVYYAWSKA